MDFFSNYSELDSRRALSPRSFVLKQIREKVESGKLRSGDQLPSERSLSQLMGVSRVTIRNALSELISEGRLKTFKNSGTIITNPAFDNDILQKENAVVFLADISSPFNLSVDQSSEDSFVFSRLGYEIQKHGYHIFLLNSKQFESNGVFSSKMFPGFSVVVTTPDYTNTKKGFQFLKNLIKEGKSIVMFGYFDKIKGIDSIYSDHKEGAEKITKWMISKGAKKIIHISMSNDINHEYSLWMRDRFSGYMTAMKDAGYEPIEPFWLPATEEAPSPEEFDRYIHLIADYLKDFLSGKNKVDGIMTITDRQAYYVAEACSLSGIKPNEDIFIGGYDNSWNFLPEKNIYSTKFSVTIDKKKELIASKLAEVTIERINKGRQSANSKIVKIDSELVVLQ